MTDLPFSLPDRAAWRRTRLIAYMWCCEDWQDGLCYQPKITRYRPNEKAGYPWLHLETVWEGTFINDGTIEEKDAIAAELVTAAAKYGIPLTNTPHEWPYGLLDPEPAAKEPT